MQQESPRQCKICGSPNHQGCGCEAKAKQTANHVETEHIKPDEQPASEAQTPAPVEDDSLEDILSPEGIIREHESFLRMAADIKTMADGFEGLCACMYDTNNYLKLIAGDLITIRKLLLKEDEVKNAAAENKN